MSCNCLVDIQVSINLQHSHCSVFSFFQGLVVVILFVFIIPNSFIMSISYFKKYSSIASDKLSIQEVSRFLTFEGSCLSQSLIGIQIVL